MADERKYYYIRLKENFFDLDEIILIESMPDGYLYANLLLKLYLKSLKNNGILWLNDNIPYTTEMIAKITRHQIGTTEKALNIFRQLGLVEVLTDGSLYATDIELYIGHSSTEADRKRQRRIELQSKKLIDG